MERFKGCDATTGGTIDDRGRQNFPPRDVVLDPDRNIHFYVCWIQSQILSKKTGSKKKGGKTKTIVENFEIFLWIPVSRAAAV